MTILEYGECKARTIKSFKDNFTKFIFDLTQYSGDIPLYLTVSKKFTVRQCTTGAGEDRDKGGQHPVYIEDDIYPAFEGDPLSRDC